MSQQASDDENNIYEGLTEPPQPLAASFSHDLFTPEEEAICMKVITAYQGAPEIWDEHIRFRSAVAVLFKTMGKHKKRKLREEDKEKINSAPINKRRKLVVENDRLLENGAHRQLLEGEAAEELTLATAPAQDFVAEAAPEPVEMNRPQKCYICKVLFKKLHAYYNQMCPQCAELNWKKRNQSADLTGRIAVVTGARVKIGYETALKLLRCGATVIATSRFPKDAALRFAQEKDFAAWKERLDIFGLDMRHLRAVEQFCSYVSTKYQKLDIIVNNAAQTIRRPPAFYKHMMPTEMTPFAQLPPLLQPLLAKQHELDHLMLEAPSSSTSLRIEEAPTSDANDSEPAAVVFGYQTKPTLLRPASMSSAALSQVIVMDEDIVQDEAKLFPKGQYDEHNQQVDNRDKNSWVLELEDVQTPELLEVLAINAISPFILNSKLKPLLDKSDFPDKHIINVSAMEGKFAFAGKTTKHPHTNCAKASLNMMTRTSANHYLESGIYMNAVETGWITENLPNPEEDRIRQQSGYVSRIPLDEVDGAARILDPIFTVILHGTVEVGKFWKNYVVVDCDLM